MILKKESIEKISNKLSLPFNGIEQDWDIEMANSKRITEFIKFYQQNKNLTTDEKFAVMAILLASYEDYLNENDLNIDDRWFKIKSLLSNNYIIFKELIDKWSLVNETIESDFFKITLLIRGDFKKN